MDDDGTILNSLQRKWFSLLEEGGDEGVRGQYLPTGSRVSVRDHAAHLLHLLCASRMYTADREGLNTTRLMELWLRCHAGTNASTPMGPVPLWLMGHVVERQEALCAMIHLGGTPSREQLHAAQRRTWKDCEAVAHMTHAADLFMEGTFAKFTEAAASARQRASPWPIYSHAVYTTGDVASQMQRLEEWSENGSAVARRMLAARTMWLRGERHLEQRSDEAAVAAFGKAIRASKHGADPFSGWIEADPVSRVW